MLLAAVLPLAQFPDSLALVTAQFGCQRDHAGVDAGHQPIGFHSLTVAHQQPAGAAGKSAMSATRWLRRRSRPERGSSRRIGSATSSVPPASPRIRLHPITPSIRGRPSVAAALAGNTWAGSLWRAAG